MVNKRSEWLRIPKGDDEGLYELTPWKRPINLATVPECPCCGVRLTPGYDICQWGMWEDKYTSYLLCKPCAKAFALNYVVPTYVYMTAKQQKRIFSVKAKHLSNEHGKKVVPQHPEGE